MDTEALVTYPKAAGRRFLEALRLEGIAIDEAYWRVGAGDHPRLYVVTPDMASPFDDKPFDVAFSIFQKQPGIGVEPSSVRFLPSSDKSAQPVRELRSRMGRGPFTYYDQPDGGFGGDEVYAYPANGVFFDSFDAIRYDYPNARVIRVPLAHCHVPLTDVAGYVGRVNSVEFRCLPPRTVLFLGPNGKLPYGPAELVFVHRPEGWDTFYDARTNSYVRGSAKPLADIDLRPLADVRPDRDQAAEMTRRITELVRDGWSVLLQPGDLPLTSVPMETPGGFTAFPPVIDEAYLEDYFHRGRKALVGAPAVAQ